MPVLLPTNMFDLLLLSSPLQLSNPLVQPELSKKLLQMISALAAGKIILKTVMILSFMCLVGGPVLMDLMNKATVHASEVISARDTIQTPYSEFNVGADLPKVSEADLAKLAKRAEKEEKQRRQALAQHQVINLQTYLAVRLQ